MARQDHDFEKRPIAQHYGDKRVSSSFASLSLHDGESPQSQEPEQQQHEPPTQHGLFRAVSKNELGVTDSDEDLSKRLLNGEDLEYPSGGKRRTDSADTVVSRSAGSETSTSVGEYRHRTSSISFANEITTSDGGKGQLGEPLPRSQPLGIPTHSHHGGSHDEDWQGKSAQQDHYMHRNEEERGREDDLDVSASGSLQRDSVLSANEELGPGQSSLNSGVTSSPEEPNEPVTPMNEMIASETTESPAKEEGGQTRPAPFWPTRKSDSQRSRSYQKLDRLGMAGSGTRRRSTRSANSSISPASAFLSQWNRKPQTVEEEPDDEGQEIGDSRWYIGRTIGYGGFSVVKEVSTLNPDTRKRVVRAVKILRKQPKNIRDDAQNDRVQLEFEHEVALWRTLRHKYLVPLIAVYDTPFATFCITKLNVGGTLHDLIRSRRQQYNEGDRGLPAPLAKRYTYQIAAGLRYLHNDMRIVHRDLKLENCLLDMSGPDASTLGGNIMLCDFGMAEYTHDDQRDDPPPDEANGEDHHNIGPAASSSMLNLSSPRLNASNKGGAANLDDRDSTLTIMGSLEYAAPEVITAKETLFSTKADVWSFGVCVYTMLTGSLPFTHQMREKLALMIEKSQWDIMPLYSAPAVRNQGPAGMAAIELIKGCLTYYQEDRWDVAGVLGARWLLNCEELYGDGNLNEEQMNELRRTGLD